MYSSSSGNLLFFSLQMNSSNFQALYEFFLLLFYDFEQKISKFWKMTERLRILNIFL